MVLGFPATLMLYLVAEGFDPMTQLEVVYRYGATPTESAMRAIDNLREVYGIRRDYFAEKASKRFAWNSMLRGSKNLMLQGFLKRAGIDVKGAAGSGLVTVLYQPGGGPSRSFYLLKQGAPKKTSGRSLFSRAPRCAPLRLFFPFASRVPFLNY